MLQLRLTHSDISRVRFSVSPLLEAVLVSLRPGQSETSRVHQRHERLLRGLSGSAALYIDLIRYHGCDIPDFIAPAPPPGLRHELTDALDAVAATPSWRVASDLRSLSESRSSPIAQDLVDGGSTTRRALRSALTAVYTEAVGDLATDIDRLLDGEVIRRATQLATYGVDHVLSTLHPMLVWRSPVMTVHCHRSGPELALSGQGLVLVPTIGRDITVMTTINAWEPAVLTYPISLLPTPPAAPVAGELDPIAPPRALLELIGRTRARVLMTVNAVAALTTSQLAVTCGISVSSASEHAGVLRRAGLIESFRRGEAVLHCVTPLGSDTIIARRSW